MEINLESTDNTGVYLINLSGVFDIYSLPKWKKIISENISKIETLILDCKEVVELDTPAIQALVSTKKFFRNHNKKFIIKNHNKKFLNYLDLYGLIGFMEDKIQVSGQEKENYKFLYGLKKLPKVLRG
jgi:anti-anti-sigma factor